MESLKTKTTREIFWSFLDSFGVYLVKFGFSIVIARTLSPEDYGLMGMIVIFISLGQMIMQSGFSMALIRKRTVIRRTYQQLSGLMLLQPLLFIVFFSSVPVQ